MLDLFMCSSFSAVGPKQGEVLLVNVWWLKEVQ